MFSAAYTTDQIYTLIECETGTMAEQKPRSYVPMMLVTLTALIASFVAIRYAYFAPKTQSTHVESTDVPAANNNSEPDAEPDTSEAFTFVPAH